MTPPVSPAITTAMILAAGFGKRMRPLTETRPKPLVELCGSPLIDWTMARLRAGGLTRFVVNSHYLGDQIAAHFKDQPDVTLSPEEVILETGGGVKKALSALGSAPFITANADIVWLDGPTPAVARMAKAFDPDIMDVLLLLHPVTTAAGDYTGVGDYTLDQMGVAARRVEQAVVPYLYAGVSVMTPGMFEGAPEGSFSLNWVFDRAEQAGRLYGLVHDGEWYHIGTPQALQETQWVIARGHTKSNTR
ncbi:MAG: mannose-1-phosphate guanylyltransferase [Rhodospirillaceae bacterium]|jgi:N-acetyl-alpha-D-muramate 1-phosphate uridylyltransferase|uniref:nucleotidyltransferase family protein n=1 Tax=Hwanghaeella sp. 1Z406 TaxID=3402811 RepID=UPI000C5A1193|nr:mannose-1-phosphate guanylyltransferase [Rhodospirillales bacterium]MAX47594.1 mannose-1-phosphate guanylyltransferase [Rhodospirillaceae bacterium]